MRVVLPLLLMLSACASVARHAIVEVPPVEHRQVDLDDPSLSKIESRILDLAGVGMTVSRLLDTIQEPDGAIEAAIHGLVDDGAITLEETD